LTDLADAKWGLSLEARDVYSGSMIEPNLLILKKPVTLLQTAAVVALAAGVLWPV